MARDIAIKANLPQLVSVIVRDLVAKEQANVTTLSSRLFKLNIRIVMAVENSPLLTDREQPYNHMCEFDLPSQLGSLWRRLDDI